MTKVAVVGASGYSGEELCGLLARHPHARLAAVTSRQHAGKSVAEALPRLAGTPAEGARFEEPSVQAILDSGAEVAFLALPHGLAHEFVPALLENGVKVVDLSADFRLRDARIFREYYGAEHGAPHLLSEAVYGIPELHRSLITGAKLVASAGCYPTSILLPLVPLVRRGLIDLSSIAVCSASGVSGAGRKSEVTLLFAECNESYRSYGLPKHRHLSEIEQELGLVAGGPVTTTFVPHLAPMNRGIHTTTFAALAPGAGLAAVEAALGEAYAKEPFVRFASRLPDVKHVAHTNFCDIAVRQDERSKRLLILSAIDNLVKGAAGQAVQNFNLMAGHPETAGLL